MSIDQTVAQPQTVDVRFRVRTPKGKQPMEHVQAGRRSLQTFGYTAGGKASIEVICASQNYVISPDKKGKHKVEIPEFGVTVESYRDNKKSISIYVERN